MTHGDEALRSRETSSAASHRPAPGAGGRSLESLLLDRILRSVSVGRIDLTWPGRAATTYGEPTSDRAAELVVLERAAVRRILTRGSLGFAEGYLDGLWDTPDLTRLLEVLAANLQARALVRRPAPFHPLQRLLHVARANTMRGARKNISYHYDLGNDFYRLWLDPSMTYSCALFPAPSEDAACDSAPSSAAGTTRAAVAATAMDGSVADPTALAAQLEAAQRAKWDSILDLVDPEPGSRLLEIGSGWGGFALHAARTRGCSVVGITLSEEQLRHSLEARLEAGLTETVEFRLQDYREIDETFDHVVSIEMFEAVGERYWPRFFGAVRRALKPGGRAGLQVITIDDARFAAYRRRADFTQVYIFPGGMLPSPAAFEREARGAGLQPGEPRFMAADYAKTLECWLARFDATADEVRSLGYDERFIRMWRYYLAYCIAGFRTRMNDVMQVALT